MRVPGAVFRPVELPAGASLPEWGLGAAWAAGTAPGLFPARLEGPARPPPPGHDAPAAA